MSEKEATEMLITEIGCIIHHIVHWDRCEDGYSVFKCVGCKLDVAKEAEDTGCGG